MKISTINNCNFIADSYVNIQPGFDIRCNSFIILCTVKILYLTILNKSTLKWIDYNLKYLIFSIQLRSVYIRRIFFHFKKKKKRKKKKKKNKKTRFVLNEFQLFLGVL